MEMVKTILANWAMWIGIAASIAFVMNIVHNWFSKPTEQQLADLQEWLKWAVAEAEKALGGGTGELKLRSVYDKALARFPWVKTFVTFEMFKGYVDKALEWLEAELSNDGAVAKYVKGE